MYNAELIKDGQQAVFLPGKIHGAEHQVYVLNMNWEANDGYGSFDIWIVDDERILKAYRYADKDPYEFFDQLSSLFQGEWKYCDAPSDEYDELVNAWPEADFITDRDGDEYNLMDYLVEWARNRMGKPKPFTVTYSSTFTVMARDITEAVELADELTIYDGLRDVTVNGEVY